MTAARLEELARIAEEITTDGYDPSLNGDLLDLARCARGWANAAAMLHAGVQLSLAQTIGGEIQLRTSQGMYIWKPTAIEAVEAAEVEP